MIRAGPGQGLDIGEKLIGISPGAQFRATDIGQLTKGKRPRYPKKTGIGHGSLAGLGGTIGQFVSWHGLVEDIDHRLGHVKRVGA